MLWRNKIFSILEYRDSTDDYIIINIIACNDTASANQIASTYGSGVIAVESTRYLVDIGDTYKDNKFYNKNNEEILGESSQEELLSALSLLVSSLGSKTDGIISRAESLENKVTLLDGLYSRVSSIEESCVTFSNNISMLKKNVETLGGNNAEVVSSGSSESD